MKIAIICFAIFVCAVCASEESDNAPIAHHAEHDGLQGDGYVVYGTNQANQGPVYRQPQLQRQAYVPQPRRSGLLDNPLMLIILLGLLNPSTTKADTTTMAAITTAAPNPYEGWAEDDGCYYLLPDTTATWDAAQNECAGAIAGGRLAVKGFNKALADRQDLSNKLKANGVTFWIGATAMANGIDDVDTTFFTAPSATIDPVGGVVLFIPELYDGASVSDNDELCGRVDSDDQNILVFEPCADEARRYMCEVCPP